MNAWMSRHSPRYVISAGRMIITDVLGGELEFPFFHALFNTLFVVSALLTIALFYSQYRQRAAEERLQDGIPLYRKVPGLVGSLGGGASNSAAAAAMKSLRSQ